MNYTSNFIMHPYGWTKSNRVRPHLFRENESNSICGKLKLDYTEIRKLEFVPTEKIFTRHRCGRCLQLAGFKGLKLP